MASDKQGLVTELDPEASHIRRVKEMQKLSTIGFAGEARVRLTK